MRNVATGEVMTKSYDKLVLSPGAPSVRPPPPGIDLPGIFHVRTVPDARAIREWIEKGTPFLSGMHRYSGFQTVRPKTRAVVVGGGFIGLETAENLVHRGFDVTLVEMLDQISGPARPRNGAHCRRLCRAAWNSASRFTRRALILTSAPSAAGRVGQRSVGEPDATQGADENVGHRGEPQPQLIGAHQGG